jgi:hypothetical protein
MKREAYVEEIFELEVRGTDHTELKLTPVQYPTISAPNRHGP